MWLGRRCPLLYASPPRFPIFFAFLACSNLPLPLFLIRGLSSALTRPPNAPVARHPASKIKDRLNYETENNVTILVNKVASDPDKAEVLGRGELQVRERKGSRNSGAKIGAGVGRE